jgi:hypothetical protein
MVNVGQSKSTRCETVQGNDSLYTCLRYGQGATPPNATEHHRLETILFVNDIRIFLELFRTNPHFLECRKTSEDATSDPSAVLALWWGVDFDLHIFDSELLHLIQETVAKPYTVRLVVVVAERSRGIAPRHNVLPPLNTTFENKLFRRSKSTRLIESTTT